MFSSVVLLLFARFKMCIRIVIVNANTASFKTLMKV